MKLSAIIFSVLFGLLSNGEVIKVWNNGEKLQWTDFKNKFNKRTTSGAASNVDFDYSPSLLNEDSIRIIIEAKFNTFESWYNPNDTSNYGLAHEQLHFDIAEIFARKFRKEVSVLNDSLSYMELLETIRSTFKMLYAQYNSYQDEYDLKTNHSINTTEQVDWSKKISTCLETLKEFSGQTITLKLKK